MARPRAGIVVTGTEVLTGHVADANGPWLSARLRELGADVAHITICRDRPADVRSQLDFMASERLDLIVTTGGLGPTADDVTTAVVAEFRGRPMVHDAELEAKINAIIAPFAERFKELDRDALAAGSRKQATVPEGAAILGPAGTAPGLVVTPAGGLRGPTVLVLPGPPRELRAMWPEAIATPAFQAALTGAVVHEERMLRLFGIPESEIAETLRVFDAGPGLDGLEVTTCLREGELEVAVSFAPDGHERYEALAGLISERHARALFSLDGTTVDEQVGRLLEGRGLAVAESCTGGKIAARLTDRPGASGFFQGGIVSYANEAKIALLDVDQALIAREGAVSVAVAEAMAGGALRLFGADFAVAVTGIAGPEGGSGEKPVGTVCFCALAAGGERISRELFLPGRRGDVRERSTMAALHLLRLLLLGEGDRG